ncbi:MAG TPA: GNAT family N-acetyltransferase [Candidatus Limnocylindrales bacterium]|nr:GNAT family N-acetyltransferase [Candidatus Limnocylindrales bacterium]
MTGATGRAIHDGLTFRPVEPHELETCADVWHVAFNDYIGRLNQPLTDRENAPVVRLLAHLRSTDPDRFVAATRPDAEGPDGERIVAFASAVVREGLWFLSMCYVLPEVQRSGVGRALLDRVGPTDGTTTVRATAVDSAQPIANALYASLGIVPRVPLLNLIGLPSRPEAFGALPSGVRPIPFERIATDGHDRLVEIVDQLDLASLGVRHPEDHRYLRTEGRRGWLYEGADGTALGYGYAGEAGRVGPVATRDPDLVAPILGHLTREVVPRGAFAMWLPGSADAAIVGALRAGFRLEPFPVLLCWDRPVVDLSRYLPISPGLL